MAVNNLIMKLVPRSSEVNPFRSHERAAEIEYVVPILSMEGGNWGSKG